jgi:hypothetical protein
MLSGTTKRMSERDLLRHAIATLAYRAEKVLRDPPAGFADARAGAGSRSGLEIVGHLGDLAVWAVDMAAGEGRWVAASAGVWDSDVARFFDGLARLDAHLARGAAPAKPAPVIFQGPIADALTHVGQLALLRGLAGAPVRPESFARAEIAVGRVGREQSANRREFDGDASRDRE